VFDVAIDRDEPASNFQAVLLPDGADAPAVARTYLNEHAGWLAPNLLDDALIVVSEIVTNAINYGRPAITLCLRSHPPSVGVEIHDTGARLPRPPTTAPAASEPNGRGLLIVNALARHWGVIESSPPPGKTVWFEIGPAESVS
jgi:anti-sigma regulatory factor (Ser/Thr protein kinase)